MNEVLVRHTEPQDAHALKAIYEHPSVFNSTLHIPFPSLEVWRTRLEKPTEGMHNLVLEIEGEVVGHLELLVVPLPRRRHAARLGMAVKEGFRRQGIGSRLLEEAIQLAEGWLGILRIELEVLVDNQAAVALYEKFGFAKEGRAKGYALRGGEYVDILRMARLRP